MKKIILFIVFITIASSLFAQQNDENTIEVAGSVQYTREVEKYIARLVISPAISYDSSENLESLQDSFFTKLKQAGINKKEVKEEQLGYLTLGYRKKGTMYVYETNSKKEFMNFLSINAFGTSIQDKFVVYKAINNEEELSKKAIQKALKRAKIVAKSANKKLGKIKALAQRDVDQGEEVFYGGEQNYIKHYKVEVLFELLDK